MIADEPALIMNGITKRFPGVVALHQVSLEVNRGEVHVLVGENGAGKSTLVKVLSGVYILDEGSIVLNGQTVYPTNPQHSQKLGISTLHQGLNLVQPFTVAENLFLGRERMVQGAPILVDWKATYQEAAQVMSGFGININPKVIAGRLSVAEQRLVEIARALSVKAQIIIMDEPTDALVAEEIDQMFKVINRMRSQGKSIIYISHRLDEIKRIGDRATVLRDGLKVATVDLKSTSVDELINLMVGRTLADKFPKETVPIGEEVLRVRGLVKKGVLHGVDCSLRAGEVLGIAGLVGAGRSELARVIFGAERPDGGQIEVLGKPYQATSPQAAIEHGIGFVPEDRKRDGVALKMSVKDNITISSLNLFSRLGFLRLQEEEKEARRFVDRLAIKTPSMKQQIRFLSGGNQQKVVLAKWLCSRCKVFILDEPTRGIDVGAKIEVYQLINEMTRQGTGVILISSELPEILGMSDRILVMHRGCIVGEFSRAEATEEKIMACAFGRQAMN